jgi:hypothetical protein
LRRRVACGVFGLENVRIGTSVSDIWGKLSDTCNDGIFRIATSKIINLLGYVMDRTAHWIDSEWDSRKTIISFALFLAYIFGQGNQLLAI